MWRCFVWLSLAGVCSGQALVAPGSRRAQEIAKFFAGGLDAVRKESGKLDCEVHPIPSRLSYNLQYWTGYDITVPVRQFATGGRDRPMVIALEVSPDGAASTKSYLYSRAGFPRKAPPEFWAARGTAMNLGGGFVIGPGKYRVTMIAADSLGRTCSKSWKVDAKSLNVPVQLAPNAVADTGLDTWKGLAGGTGKMSVYVHAAPFMRRRVMTKLSAWDRSLLLSSLTSLLDVSGYAEAHVTVFDFDGRRVLFESENFDSAAYDKLVDVLFDLSFGTVSVQTLAGPDDGGFLAKMMTKEVERKEPADSVIFLGPSWRYGPKISPLLRELRGQLPATYYVSLTPWFATAIDLLEKFVKAGPRGRVLTIYQPTDLIKAVREIREKRN